MGWKYALLLLILQICLPNVISQEPSGYRLPETFIPSKYVVNLEVPETVFTGETTEFKGDVSINFRVTSGTTEVKLHHRATTISQVRLSSTLGVMAIADQKYNETTEIYTLTLSAPLDVATDYTLTLKYTGDLDTQNMKGFYRSTYKDENNKTAYMVTTQFQATHARHAFPCFDEPQYKATFLVSLTYPSRLNALSNTPNATSVVIDTNTKTTFKETPVMSTYLNAFIISDFTCTEGDTIATGVPHRVCSRDEEKADRAWAVEIGPPLMRALESMTGIKYGSQVAKMDQVAIPDFSAGAMENWGLVTYRETGLLWSKEDSHVNYKKSIALVIAHEFTHMWFGNLVTCKWWDFTFLNEGFARYFQYFAAALVKQLSEWELEKHFNIEQVQTALVADSTIGAQALTSVAATQDEISGKFGTISYNKGASIYRMVETTLMGSDNFLDGLRSYLSTYSQQGTVPENLWTSLSPFVPKQVLPAEVDLGTVLKNWVELSGHPVVTVERNGNDVVLTQKRFLLVGREHREYYIPISYTTSSDPTKFSNTTVKVWLKPGEVLTLSGILAENSWIIVNNRQSGFYRVNYENSLWSAIKSALHKNHLEFDVLNRAQIVSDVLNFARSGSNNGTVSFSYSEAMDILGYLHHEADYYPWQAAFVGSGPLLQRIGFDTAEGVQFTSWMLSLMKHVYSTVSFENLDSSNQMYSMKQMLILNRACKFGHQECVSKTKELFLKYKNSGEKVPKNLRTIVYCNALRQSDDIQSDFNFLWQKYGETKQMTEILTILSGLGCTEDPALLKWYLGQTINVTSGIRYQDFASVWSNVYASSKIGATTAMEFITENYVEVAAYYKDVGSLIFSIANYFYADDQLATLQTLIDKTEISESHKKTAENALSSAKLNIEFAVGLKKDLKSYFEKPTPTPTEGSATIAKASFIVVLLFIVLQTFVV